MPFSLFGRVLAVALLVGVVAAPVAAAELLNRPPLTEPEGEQVDFSTGVGLPQSFTASGTWNIQSIVWWGFHGTNSGGPDNDDFLVSLNGEEQTGPLTKTEENGLTRYELDIVDTPMVAGADGELDIINDGEDVEWFWQYSNVDRDLLAFSLQGTAPEPNSLALVGLAGLAWIGARRRRRG